MHYNSVHYSSNQRMYTILLKHVGSGGCATIRAVPGSIPGGVTGFFSVTYSFRPYHGPGVDSASSENEYQEHFLGVKASGT